jgi:hypothetical protein
MAPLICVLLFTGVLLTHSVLTTSLTRAIIVFVFVVFVLLLYAFLNHFPVGAEVELVKNIVDVVTFCNSYGCRGGIIGIV